MCFRVGKETAQTLEEFFQPYYSYEQIVSLPNFWFAVSAKVNGVKEFGVLKTIHLKQDLSRREDAIRHSLSIYGREAEACGETSKIEKDKRSLTIPITKLQEPTLLFKEEKLNTNILHIEKKKELLSVPIVRVQPSPKIVPSIVEFDKTIIEPKPPSLPKIPVPIYRKPILILPKSVPDSFEATIDEHLQRRAEYTKKSAVTLSTEEKVAKQAGASVPSPATGKEEEIPEFLKLAFGEGGGRIKTTGPKIILFKDSFGSSYLNLLEEICKRIYREREGGEPKARRISTYDNFWRRELEKWLDPSHKIITIDLDYTEDGKYPWKDVDDRELKDRLNELYTGQIGFIIFRTSDDRMFGEYRMKLNNINKASNYRLNIVELVTQPLSEGFANLIWGKVLESVPMGKFDEVFNKAMKAFQEKLEAIKDEEKGLFKSATTRNKGQIEGKKVQSDLHFNIKVFLVRYLVHKLRKSGFDLKTHEEIRDKIKSEVGTMKPVPDIQVDQEVYEVETLFGEGADADKKIDETIDKYDDEPGIEKVNIVIDNLGFLMHLRELKMKQEQFKRKRFTIEFHTIDLKKEVPISLKDFVKEVGYLLG